MHIVHNHKSAGIQDENNKCKRLISYTSSQPINGDNGECVRDTSFEMKKRTENENEHGENKRWKRAK